MELRGLLAPSELDSLNEKVGSAYNDALYTLQGVVVWEVQSAED
jgi:hypothetical protein